MLYWEVFSFVFIVTYIFSPFFWEINELDALWWDESIVCYTVLLPCNYL